jgi:hypothetical protein
MLVEATVPLVGAKFRLEANGAPPVLEISKPAGALMVILAVRSVPPMRNGNAVEALPSEAVKPDRLAGVAEIAGLAVEITVPDNATVWESTPGLVSVMLPETGPRGAVGARRA